MPYNIFIVEKKLPFITTHYWFFILFAGIAAIIVFQIFNHLSRQKQFELLEALQEAGAVDTALVLERMEQIHLEQTQMEEAHLEWMERIQEALEKVYGAVNLSSQKMRDEGILGILYEQMVNDYTERAFQYFREEDYVNAARDFNRALRYQRRNTTLMFYQVYSSYLGQQDRALTGSELADIQTRIRELRQRGFRAEEQRDYSVAEMEQKVIEMEYNLGEQR